jgi:arginyl-tRNA synthetase
MDKPTIKQILKEILKRYSEGADFDILTTPDPSMGDYSTNLAFKMKTPIGNTKEKAERLKLKLMDDKDIQKYFSGQPPEVVPPGFINFRISDDFLKVQFGYVLTEKEKYGASSPKKTKINIEFVSANPTGPPTVGNARAASFGDTLGNVLRLAGFDVTKEYYINDVGVQVHKFGSSIAKKIFEYAGKSADFGEDLYKGDYIAELAEQAVKEKITTADDKPEKASEKCQAFGVEKMISGAEKTLEDLGIKFDVWFRESQLHKNGEVEQTLEQLNKTKFVYEKEGAKWLKVGDILKEYNIKYPGTDDLKDAVIIKNDGATSYLMNDIAYSKNKFLRGADKAINIWGTDHHGDVPRLLAGVAAIGYNNRLELLLHQLVLIKQKDELQRMSKREGKFVLLSDLIKEVGRDAIRFFFLAKDLNTHMEFDIDLAKEQSKTNPVFYAQYAFARLNSIFEKSGTDMENIQLSGKLLSKLTAYEELRIMRSLAKFPDLIEDLAKNYQVHLLPKYVLELATDFHHFYEKQKVIQDDKELQTARIILAKAVHIVLKNCFDLMGITAPNKMYK